MSLPGGGLGGRGAAGEGSAARVGVRAPVFSRPGPWGLREGFHMARAPGRSLRRIAHVAALSTVVAVVAVGADIALARPGGRAPAKAGNGLPDVDRRFAGVRVAPTAAQLAAVRALGDVEVGWTELGTPHSLRRR